MRKMDAQKFPLEILNRHHIPGQLPPQVVTWGQLKQWAAQHAAGLGPGFLDKLKSLQTLQYYHSPPQDVQQSPNVQMQVPMPQPGPAPQVNMLRPQQPQARPPSAFPQIPPGQLAFMKLPTPEEIQNARNNLPENSKHVQDMQIQRIIVKKRQDIMIQQAMRSGNLQQAQQLQAFQNMQQGHMLQQQQQLPPGQMPNPYAQALQRGQVQPPVVTPDGRKAPTPKPTPSQPPRQLGNHRPERPR